MILHYYKINDFISIVVKPLQMAFYMETITFQLKYYF